MQRLALLGAVATFAVAQQTVPLALEPNGDSGAPSISDDGKLVVFESRASNFVEGDEKDSWDVFLYERATGAVTRISDEGPLPSRSPIISGDGRWIVFQQAQPARASTSSDPYACPTEHPWKVGLHDRGDGSLRWIGEGVPSCEREQPWQCPSISRDGSRIVFTAKQNGLRVLQSFETATGRLSVISMTKDGKASAADVQDPAISPNGRYLAFSTCDRTLTPPPKITGEGAGWFDFGDHVRDRHILRRDLQSGENVFVSNLAFNAIGYAEYSSPRVSDDGRFVAYDHNDPRKLGSTHVGFVSDLERQEAGRLLPVSNAGEGEWWQGTVTVEWLSADGRRALVATGNPEVPVVPADPGAFQITLRDFEKDTWTLLSRASDGTPGNGNSFSGSAAADLSVFAFSSASTNLVSGDTNKSLDVFLFDPAAQRTTRIVPSARFEPAVSTSSQPNAESMCAQMSEDGEFVVFASKASNFEKEDTVDSWDIFLLTRATGGVIRVSKEPHDAVSAPVISGDGKWIAYWSGQLDAEADGHATLRLFDRVRGETKSVADHEALLDPFGPTEPPSISRDGSKIVFGDTLLEVKSGTTTTLRLDDRGKPIEESFSDAVISGDGKSVAFWSQSPSYAPYPLSKAKQRAGGPYDWHIFVRDLKQRTVRAVDDVLVSEGFPGHPREPRLSEDGSRVACNHDNGESSPYMGFVVDLIRNDSGRLVPIPDGPSKSRDLVSIVWLSPDGKAVLVSSKGAAFSAKPEPLHRQLFLHQLDSAEWIPMSRSATGEFANRPCEAAAASRDLSRIVFESEADNLVPGDTNNARDIFIVDRQAGKISRVEAKH